MWICSCCVCAFFFNHQHRSTVNALYLQLMQIVCGAMPDLTDNIFTREFEVDQCEKPLVLHQREVGDVSCVVWDAALVLSSYLQKLANDKRDYFQGQKILELGAGVGCVGLTAACLGADVVLTDLPEVLPLLELNITSNSDLWESRGRAVARALKWEDDVFEESPDILLLADCVYYKESIPPLVSTVRKVCSDKTEVLICQEQRPTDVQRSNWTEFIERLSQHSTITRIPLSEQHPRFNSPDILLFKAKLKPS